MSVLLVVTFLVSCGSPARKRARTDSTHGSPETQALLAKLDPYMQCLEHAERIFHIADRYLGRDVSVPVSPDPEDCLEGIEQARTLAPSLPEVEAAAAAYGRAMTAVFAATKSRGQTDRAAVFRDFDVAQGVLFDHVFRLNHQARVDEVARRQERDGRTYTVIADELMLRGEELVRFGAFRWDRMGDIDVPAMTAQVARFEMLLDELTELMRDPPKPAVPGMDRHHDLTFRAKAFLIAAKQLASRASGQVPYSDAEKIMIASNNGVAVVGSPAAMITAYNNLATIY